MKSKIAIQGIEGSNHHKVVTDFISKDSSIIGCSNFLALINHVLDATVDFGIMAIENSIAGSILPNYSLISNNHLEITAEYYLDIKHNLVALKGQSIEDIDRVNSHQMAFLQCGSFFENNPHLKLIEDVDTALPAKLIANKKLAKTAALVPDGTAELFGLDVLEKHIQDHNNNSTRFVKVEKRHGENGILSCNKASICFELEHKAGSLYKVLDIFNQHDINLTKIQSVPILNTKWNYGFYMDIVFNHKNDILQILSEVKSKTHNYKTLGIYTQAAP